MAASEDELSRVVARRERPMAGSDARHFLQPCLLLLLAERPDHGYDLHERLKPLGVDETDPTCVYRALRGLERAGLVGSAWTPSRAGPARRTYHLTTEGYAALAAGAEDFRGIRTRVDVFLDRFAELQVDRATASRRLRSPDAERRPAWLTARP